MIKRVINSTIAFVFYSFLVMGQALAADASLLPNGLQQFFDNNGNPLSSGKVYFYVPNTTTPKTTWQDAAKATANANPVVLDAAGRAKIYGEGSYRQILRKSNNDQVWDVVTTSYTPSGSAVIATGDGDLVGTIKPWAGLVAPNQYAFAYGQEVSRTTYSVLFTAITLQQTITCASGSPTASGFSDTSQIPVGGVIESTCFAPGTTVLSKTSTTVTFNNNSAVSTSDAVRIFLYGNGNGSSTFNLPDLRGQAVVGRNNMGGTAGSDLTSTYYGTNPNATGAFGGAQSKGLTTPNLPAYTPTGTINTPTITNTFSVSGTNSYTPTGSVSTPTITLNNADLQLRNTSGASGFDAGGNIGAATITATSSTPIFTGNAVTLTSVSSALTFTGAAQGGTATAFSLVQPSKTLNYIIKITPDSNSAEATGVTSIEGMTGDIACGAGLLCTGNIISSTQGEGISGYVLTGNGIGFSSTYQGFTQTGTGAVTRTWQSKNADIINIRDFDANACTGSDDTTVIQTALNANAGRIYAPRFALCKITAKVTVPASTWFELNNSSIDCAFTSGDCIELASGARLTNGGVTSTVTRVAGAHIYMPNNGTVQNITLTAYFQGINATGSTLNSNTAFIENINAFSPATGVGSYCIKADNYASSFIRTILCVGSFVGTQPAAGFIIGGGDTLIADAIHMVAHGRGLQVAPAATNFAGAVFLSNSLFDSPNAASVPSCDMTMGTDQSVVNFNMMNVGCSNTVGVTAPGLNIATTNNGSINAVNIINLNTGNNTNSGVIISGGNANLKNIHFTSGYSAGNTGSGIQVGGEASNITIKGMTLGPAAGRGGNTFAGLNIIGGSAVTNLTISDSPVGGNTSTGIFNGSASPYSILRWNNPGDTVNTLPVGASIVLPGSGTGAATFIAPAAAGTPTITTPTGSGTIAVTATSPITLNSTTGDIGCSTCATQSFVTSAIAAQAAPAVNVYTSGSGTHTTAANAKYLLVRACGGGGGGAGSGTAPGAASAGGNTTFGTALLTANGGAAGSTVNGAIGAGGSATGGDINIAGGNGGAATTNLSAQGGKGGDSPFFSGGGVPAAAGALGGNAGTSYGAGGAGGSDGPATPNTGSGGGAGGCLQKILTSPLSSYAYAVGALGTGGTAGGSGAAGGNGVAGIIYVETHFQ